jgi:DNA-binding IclR family transcriptional regulator
MIQPTATDPNPDTASVTTDKLTPGAASSRKVLAILTYFEPGRTHASVDELAEFIGAPKSTTYRYISLLRETGLLVADASGRCHLAPRLIRMANAARAAISFLEPAAPIMEQLSNATRETVLLVERIGDSGVCVAKHDSDQLLRLSFEVGTAVPLHRGAASKLLLAYLPEEEREQYLERAAKLYADLPSRLPELRAKLDQIRREGIVFSQSELVQELWGIAAPVKQGNSVIGAISLVGPVYRMQKGQEKQLEKLVAEAGADISSKLHALITDSFNDGAKKSRVRR